LILLQEDIKKDVWAYRRNEERRELKTNKDVKKEERGSEEL